jgi:hypothetical protein
MPFCPNCGKEYSPEASYCNNCGSRLPSNSNVANNFPQYQPQYLQPQTKPNLTAYVIGGIISSLIALLFLPPLFGLIAIACGGLILSKTGDGGQKQLGWFIIILGAVCMFIGFVLGVVSVLA